MPKYDAIIIGGGHNGLVTAACLARAGRRVLVLERRELVGGCAVAEELWPGYRVSTGAYWNGPFLRHGKKTHLPLNGAANGKDAQVATPHRVKPQAVERMKTAEKITELA
jgi:phytoene dehydrogenase-like protein